MVGSGARGRGRLGLRQDTKRITIGDWCVVTRAIAGRRLLKPSKRYEETYRVARPPRSTRWTSRTGLPRHRRRTPVPVTRRLRTTPPPRRQPAFVVFGRDTASPREAKVREIYYFTPHDDLRRPAGVGRPDAEYPCSGDKGVDPVSGPPYVDIHATGVMRRAPYTRSTEPFELVPDTLFYVGDNEVFPRTSSDPDMGTRHHNRDDRLVLVDTGWPNSGYQYWENIAADGTSTTRHHRLRADSPRTRRPLRHDGGARHDDRERRQAESALCSRAKMWRASPRDCSATRWNLPERLRRSRRSSATRTTVPTTYDRIHGLRKRPPDAAVDSRAHTRLRPRSSSTSANPKRRKATHLRVHGRLRTQWTTLSSRRNGCRRLNSSLQPRLATAALGGRRTPPHARQPVSDRRDRPGAQGIQQRTGQRGQPADHARRPDRRVRQPP